MRRCYRAAIALLVLITLATARAGAQDIQRGVTTGATHTYDIFNRFTAILDIPERGSTRTEVLIRMRTAIRVMSTQGGFVLRLRFEEIDFQYREISPLQAVGMRFNSNDPPASDAGNQAATLRMLVGETIEVIIGADRVVWDISQSLAQTLPTDNAGNLMRRFLREGLLGNSLLWIHWPEPDAADTEPGGSWESEFLVRVQGEGDIEFAPRFTYDEHEAGLAILSIDGGAVYTDQRPAAARLDGVPELDLEAAQVVGGAAWNTNERVLEMMDMTASATLRQMRRDPLGMRIEDKRVEHEYSIQRVR